MESQLNHETTSLKSGKIKKVVVAVIALSVIAAVVVYLLWPKGYRNISLVDMFGIVTFDRGDEKDVPVYADMNLQSGDTMRTGADGSYAGLNLDLDKYIYIEESSEVAFALSGVPGSSNTTINLNYGAIVNEIENPLNEGESYEVKTPNALMAVRGTRFRVSTYEGEDGIFYTRITTLEGGVECSLTDTKGNKFGESTMAKSGYEALIYHDPSSGETDFVTFDDEGNPLPIGTQGNVTRPVNYQELPEQLIGYLMDRIENGVVYESLIAADIDLTEYIGNSYSEPVLGAEDTFVSIASNDDNTLDNQNTEGEETEEGDNTGTTNPERNRDNVITSDRNNINDNPDDDPDDPNTPGPDGDNNDDGNDGDSGNDSDNGFNENTDDSNTPSNDDDTTDLDDANEEGNPVNTNQNSITAINNYYNDTTDDDSTEYPGPGMSDNKGESGGNNQNTPDNTKPNTPTTNVSSDDLNSQFDMYTGENGYTNALETSDNVTVNGQYADLKNVHIDTDKTLNITNGAIGFNPNDKAYVYGNLNVSGALSVQSSVDVYGNINGNLNVSSSGGSKEITLAGGSVGNIAYENPVLEGEISPQDQIGLMRGDESSTNTIGNISVSEERSLYIWTADGTTNTINSLNYSNDVQGAPNVSISMGSDSTLKINSITKDGKRVDDGIVASDLGVYKNNDGTWEIQGDSGL